MFNDTDETAVAEARLFAKEAHAGQFRNNAVKTSTFEHVEEVAMLLQSDGRSTVEVIDGYCHDILEDTKRTRGEIERRFGRIVGSDVYDLTDPPNFVRFHNVAILRKKILQSEILRTKCDRVKRTKVADSISNVRSIGRYPLLHWTPQQCIDYTLGARIVAEVCRGESSFLDEKFARVYGVAMRAHERRRDSARLI